VAVEGSSILISGAPDMLTWFCDTRIQKIEEKEIWCLELLGVEGPSGRFGDYQMWI